MEIQNKIKVVDFLDSLFEIGEISSYALKESLNLFGGRSVVMQLIFNFFTAEPDNLENANYISIYQDILFGCSDNKSYEEDWDEVWWLVKDLPLKFIVDSLESYPPGKGGSSADKALSYLLSKKYNISFASDLTKEIYEELSDLFYDEPEAFKKFKKVQHFLDELLEFNDPRWLYETYSEFSFDKEVILELLKKVVETRKLDTPEKLNVFLGMVKYYAPENSFSRKYRDAFVLEIFEANDQSGIDTWSEESIAMWKDEFYNIDFEWSNSEVIKDQINDSHKQEANHISEQLKINPNYRHD